MIPLPHRLRVAGGAIALAVAVAVGVAACTPVEQTTTTAGPTTTDGGPETSTTAPDLVPVCLAGDIEFGTTGLVGTPGEDGGDAGRLAGVTWQSFEGCERVTLEFVTADGAPASLLGPASAQLRDDAGIVRLILPPRVDATTVADGLVDGDLIERYVVVRDDAGGLFVDLHLSSAALASGVAVRAFDLDAPARAIIDLRPGGSPATSPALFAGTLVLTLPVEGPVALPFLIRGYARDLAEGIDAALVIEGTVVASATVEAAPQDDAWRTFESVIAAGPPGPVDLVVDAGEDTVTIVLDITG